MQKSVKIAIIGLGNIGKAVAENLNKSGRPFIVVGRDFAQTREIAKQWKSATVKDIATALKEADMILPAIYFQPLGEFIEQYANDLKGKTLIDPSNPIALLEDGGLKKIIGEKESAGEILSDKLPQGAKLVKAFASLSANSLINAAYQEPERAVLFYADNDGQNAEVEQLIKDCGFEPLHIGGLDSAIRMEVFGDLNEFGALGKTVTLAEAKAKI